MIKRFIAFVVGFLMIGSVFGADEVTICPQYAVGDTLNYRTTMTAMFALDVDTLFTSTITMLPSIIVEERNDTGFIIKTTNLRESATFDCDVPKSKDIYQGVIENLDGIVSSLSLRIQLETL